MFYIILSHVSYSGCELLRFMSSLYIGHVSLSLNLLRKMIVCALLLTARVLGLLQEYEFQLVHTRYQTG